MLIVESKGPPNLSLSLSIPDYSRHCTTPESRYAILLNDILDGGHENANDIG